MITLETLSEAVEYFPEAGEFLWRVRPGHHFKYPKLARGINNRRAGQRADRATGSHGYREIRILGSVVLAHRAALLLTGQAIAKGNFVDHINGDRQDNRLENLRVVSRQKNAWNMQVLKRSTLSPYKGVSPSSSKWCARIRVGGKRMFIGTFASETDAAVAYDEAARLYFGAFARLNFPRDGEQSAFPCPLNLSAPIPSLSARGPGAAVQPDCCDAVPAAILSFHAPENARD